MFLYEFRNDLKTNDEKSHRYDDGIQIDLDENDIFTLYENDDTYILCDDLDDSTHESGNSLSVSSDSALVLTDGEHPELSAATKMNHSSEKISQHFINNNKNVLPENIYQGNANYPLKKKENLLYTPLGSRSQVHKSLSSSKFLKRPSAAATTNKNKMCHKKFSPCIFNLPSPDDKNYIFKKDASQPIASVSKNEVKVYRGNFTCILDESSTYFKGLTSEKGVIKSRRVASTNKALDNRKKTTSRIFDSHSTKIPPREREMSHVKKTVKKKKRSRCRKKKNSCIFDLPNTKISLFGKEINKVKSAFSWKDVNYCKKVISSVFDLPSINNKNSPCETKINDVKTSVPPKDKNYRKKIIPCVFDLPNTSDKHSTCETKINDVKTLISPKDANYRKKIIPCVFDLPTTSDKHSPCETKINDVKTVSPKDANYRKNIIPCVFDLSTTNDKHSPCETKISDVKASVLTNEVIDYSKKNIPCTFASPSTSYKHTTLGEYMNHTSASTSEVKDYHENYIVDGFDSPIDCTVNKSSLCGKEIKSVRTTAPDIEVVNYPKKIIPFTFDSPSTNGKDLIFKKDANHTIAAVPTYEVQDQHYNVIPCVFNVSNTSDKSSITGKEISHAENTPVPKTEILDYIEAEKQDITDPGWDEVRNLETNLERYRNVRRCWNSNSVPNPYKNLTHHSYRKRHFGEKKPTVQGKRKASTSLKFTLPKRPRLCTYFLDEQMNNLIAQKEACIKKLEKKFSNSLLELDQRCFEHQNLLLNTHFQSDAHRYQELQNLRNARAGEISSLRSEFEYKTEQREKQFRSNAGKLLQAKDEVVQFCHFYGGMLGEGGQDPTLLSPYKVQELEDIESIYHKLRHFYK